MAKVTLHAESTTVPLDKLDPSPENVRRTHRAAEIEGLAANIAAEGLLSRLGVVEATDVEGRPTGRYEVAAGERRRLALNLLVKQKKLPKAAQIPCRLIPREQAASASLSENVQRVAMHPADEVQGFAQLHDEGRGLTPAQIAARHGVSEHVVKQRLRLGTASPRLLHALRDEELTLAQLTAFCVTDDRAEQERVFDALLPMQRSEYAIRRMLTEGKVPTKDRRVRLIGLDTYEAAGGGVERDLFSADDAAWVTDIALLNKLATERLEEAAGSVRAEGWAWVVAVASLPPDVHAYGRKFPSRMPLSADDEARLSMLAARYDEIEAATGDVMSDEEAAEIDRIEEEISTIQAKQEQYAPEDKAEAGVFVTLAEDGIRVQRGWVRPEDRKPAERPVTQPETDEREANEAQQTVERAERLDEKPANLSAALEADLRAHRTAGLQAEVARRPGLALRVLLHSMLLQDMHQGHSAVCRVVVQQPCLRTACPSIDEAPARQDLAGRRAEFATWKLPEGRELLPWLMGRGDDEVLEMLAVMVAQGIDAGSADWTTPKGAESFAAQVATLGNLDMRAWWKPTAESYFDRVPKGLILSAMREGAGDAAAGRDAGEKKAVLAAAATSMLDGKGWLPSFLRRNAASIPGPMPGVETDAGGAMDTKPAVIEGEAGDGIEIGGRVAAE